MGTKQQEKEVNIAYFGDDFFINCFYVLKNHGHNISYVFASSDDGYGEKLVSLAKSNNTPVLIDKIEDDFLDKIIREHNIDLVFSAGYGRKIHFDYESIPSINMHPTLLPIGRGPNALAWVTLKYKNFAGVTFHKLSDVFDEGNILYQKPVMLEKQDGWEIYMAKLQLEITGALSVLLENFSEFYAGSVSQEVGSTWPLATALDRSIKWEMPHKEIHSIVKAFGRWGAITFINGKYLLFNDLELSAYSHNIPAGKLLNEDRYAITISTIDGIAILKKNNILREIDIESAKFLGLAK